MIMLKLIVVSHFQLQEIDINCPFITDFIEKMKTYYVATSPFGIPCFAKWTLMHNCSNINQRFEITLIFPQKERKMTKQTIFNVS